MKSYRRWLHGVAFLAVTGMSILTASAQATKPAGAAPTTKPGSLDAAMKYAPQGAAGVVHAEIKALMKDVLAAVAKEPEFKDFEPNKLETIGKLAEKIDSLDVFVPPGKPALTDFLLVVHGPLTAADVNRFVQSLAGVEEDLLQKKEKQKGRYELALASIPYEVVVGGESPDLPAGVTAIGMDDKVSPEALVKLGKGANADLAKLLSTVDTAAPIWLALQMEKMGGESNGPASISGSVYLLGGGKSVVTAPFRDANSAQEAVASLDEGAKGDDLEAKLLVTLADLRVGPGPRVVFEGNYSPMTFTAEANDPRLPGGVAVKGTLVVSDGNTTITLTAKMKDSLVPAIIAVLAEAREEEKKAVSIEYLKEIGATMAPYAADHDDLLPSDLMDLVKAKVIPVQMLASPVTGRKVNVDGNGLPVGAFESDYVLVKFPVPMPKIKNPNTMVLAYERPENYKKAGTIVLYVDEHVEWLKIDEFNKQLKATQDWIGAQAKDAKKDK